jgi:large-conductance mechanosensitive channel
MPEYLAVEFMYLLTFVVFILMIYAFIDHNNKYYGNVVATLFASIIAWMLSLAVGGGQVMDVIGGRLVPVYNEWLSMLYLILALACSFFTVLFIVLALREKLTKRNEARQQQQYGE